MSAWVAVGAEVVECSSSWGPFPSYGRVYKIGKVHKNGNFVLEGETQQWRATGNHASMTGERGSSKTLVPLNDKTRAEMDLAKRYREARDVVAREAERMEKVWRHGDVEEVIAEAGKIAEGQQ